MFRTFTILMLTCLTANLAIAQSVEMLKQLENPQKTILAENSFLSKKVNASFKEIKQNTRLISLDFNADYFLSLTAKKNENLNIQIPGIDEIPIELELVPVIITSADFNVSNLADKSQTQAIIDQSTFYRGKIKGDDSSLASLSFINNELSGMIIDSSGTRILGKNQDPASTETSYILYYENDITTGFQFLCGSLEKDFNQTKNARIASVSDVTECKYLGVYIETDKSVYDKLGSKANVTAYVLGMFNQVATLFNAENIAFRISGLYIWDTLDPYASSQTNLDDALNVFQSYWNAKNNNFPGQFAHLLTCRPLGGGNANMEAMDDRSKAYGVNMIYGNYKIVPAYSWDVKVFAHELGHNLGSPHTHSCIWPGGAIDNCTTVEGNCPPGPTPVNGGTIMSYCQNTSIGINLALGFGPLPGNLIRSRVSNNATLPVSNSVPSDLLAYNVAARSARLQWNFSGSNTTHIIQYKNVNSSGNWIEFQTTKNTILLSNLLPNTSYNWRVKGNCSEYTEIQTFATNNSQPTYCQPADQCSKAIGIGLNSVTINNLPLSVASDCAVGGYTFNTSAPVPQLSSGQSYAFNFSLIGYNFAQQVKAWIDYNNDGEFTTDELIAETKTSLTESFSGTFKIPDNQISLTTRIRIRSNYFYAGFNSCDNLSLGETEDYLVNLIQTTPLPVKFISVNVSRQNNNALLQWETTDEDAGFIFDIEKSTNAKDFQRIGKVAGSGPSSQTNKYLFSEELGTVNVPSFYYRIRMPDGSDNFIYSRIVALNFNALANSDLTIWPNPFQDHLKLSIKTLNRGLLYFTLYNIQGRLIRSEQKYIYAGETNYEMKNLPGLSVGNYILKIYDDKNSYSEILIKSP
ncbi:M12 family metallo-peptidase [Dyadobacter sp. CY356]|uniref:M12 family metallo-peptidase n=1 Tax=Dyadobacter sp. CY356 TaxID=2906442 RepID=UPI001F29D96C|nr:M12 family metallo-peptidase [Dyadobacter sp. CY356]MCF0056141.1 M12 family metallo-peptidase [Dyadobacter sp. CY356]